MLRRRQLAVTRRRVVLNRRRVVGHKEKGVGGRDALEGKGPQWRPQRWLDRRFEEVAKAVGDGYCRLQMPLGLTLGVRGTVAGRGGSLRTKKVLNDRLHGLLEGPFWIHRLQAVCVGPNSGPVQLFRRQGPP